MFNLINFLIILILWGLIFLIIKDKETFRLHPFVPWGDTLQGCINRCQISSEQKLDKNYCETTCNNCPSKDCIWKQQQNKEVEINKDKGKSKNKFEIQVIPDNKSVLVQWTYDKTPNEFFNLYELPQIMFSENENFTLKNNSDVDINYTYDSSKNSFINNTNNYEIISLYQIIKNGIYINQKENENGWFLSKDEDHSLFSIWHKNDDYKQYKKQDKNVEKYILELINTDNFNTGIMINEYKDKETEITNKIFYSKMINDLKPDTNYKLVIYPLFEKDNINKELSDIITFSTNDNKFRDST